MLQTIIQAEIVETTIANPKWGWENKKQPFSDQKGPSILGAKFISKSNNHHLKLF